MTEAEWFASSDVDAMLEQVRGKVSDRKLRLFAVACCRRIWTMLGDPRCQKAVRIAEYYADGLAERRELAIARTEVIRAESGPAGRAAYWSANNRMSDEVVQTIHVAAVEAVARAAVESVSVNHDAVWDRTVAVAQRDVAADLREIVGNPFRSPRLDTDWLAWRSGTIRQIARNIYDTRRFDEVPVLADALEDAGCDDTAMLRHFREQVPHVRGCWAVDLVLGQH
jgi:hypothetical protein